MSAPLPEALHRLKGTRPTRAAVHESGYASGRPKMPKTLSPIAKAKWKEMVKQLSKRGTLTSVDSGILEIFCELWARWRMYVNDVNTRGAYVQREYVNKNGEIYTREEPNPSTKLATAMENSLQRYLKEFSATPASRERTKPAAPPPPNKDAVVPGSAEADRLELEAAGYFEQRTEEENEQSN